VERESEAAKFSLQFSTSAESVGRGRIDWGEEDLNDSTLESQEEAGKKQD
jgi:hypothetical protein